jgi:hypothetical protein
VPCIPRISIDEMDPEGSEDRQSSLLFKFDPSGVLEVQHLHSPEVVNDGMTST